MPLLSLTIGQPPDEASRSGVSNRRTPSSNVSRSPERELLVDVRQSGGTDARDNSRGHWQFEQFKSILASRYNGRSTGAIIVRSCSDNRSGEPGKRVKDPRGPATVNGESLILMPLQRAAAGRRIDRMPSVSQETSHPYCHSGARTPGGTLDDQRPRARAGFVCSALSDVTFGYRDRRRTGAFGLRDLSLTIQPGSLTGLLGPNGCGKTTLLKLLSGVLHPESGSVTLQGRALEDMSRREVARHIATVPQETHPAFDYTCLEMVLMGRHPHLGAFEFEGPDGSAHRAGGDGGDRHGAPRRANVHDAQRRREAARRHRRRTGAGGRHAPARRADRLARSRLSARRRSSC